MKKDFWTEEEKIEYKELCKFCRHDDRIAYQAGEILVPIAFSILPLAVANKELKIPLFFVSISILGFWFLICDRLAFYTSVRRNRAIFLEKKAGLKLFTYNKTPPTEIMNEHGSKISIRRIRKILFIFLFLGWLIVLIFTK